jgi:hypothetical protein
LSTQVTKVSPASLASAPHSGPGPIERILNALPWWALPATVVTVLTLFGIYSVWTAFLSGGINQSGPYLSPFYSPTIWKTGPVSPALWVLGSPLLFRATCYYYRKAYYRSFFWDPPSCAVGELRHRKYRGETAFPLFLNNLHRFLFYLVLIVTGFLWYDVYLAFWAPNGHLQIGLGTIIMLVNVILLSGYTFGCHSWRHLVGGGLDCYSKSAIGQARYRAWRWVTVLNQRHPVWAWCSMFSVVITDVYIHLLRAGIVIDPHIVF